MLFTESFIIELHALEIMKFCLYLALLASNWARGNSIVLARVN